MRNYFKPSAVLAVKVEATPLAGGATMTKERPQMLLSVSIGDVLRRLADDVDSRANCSVRWNTDPDDGTITMMVDFKPWV